jgi:ArsR family transcriptional regulator, arsenate/arsenite/antimonite-responsive transcriptional repressor
MDLTTIYQCFSDPTRLRMLHLLTQTPLCVCHFQEILGEPQVKVSKHLAYLRRRGLVSTKQEKNWVIYSLPDRRSRELEANLNCLQDCARADAKLKGDLKALAKLRQRDEPSVAVACC